MLKRVLLVLASIFGIYLTYVFITAVLLFQFHEPNTTGYQDTVDPQRFFGEEESVDRVVLVEDRQEAGVARINLIENAKESIDLAYFALHEGTAADILLSSLVEAADRGVKVRFLLDGIFHNLWCSRDLIYAYTAHPNIELKFYEPLDPLRPWTWNNRLHDKITIVDNHMAMIGGRNIGDRYFAPPGFEGASNDRDVLVINTSSPNTETSVLGEMKDYFADLWVHPYTAYPVKQLSYRQEGKGEEQLSYLRELLQDYYRTHPTLFGREIHWLDKSVATNKVTFLHNPIERLNKEPWVWQELTALLETAEQSVLVQSPYIIPSSNMMDYVSKENVSVSELSILTNSLSASPNVLAYSGYSRYREAIVAAGIDIFEFQGPNESIHAKTYIFDERLIAIGAFNLDPRSAFLSTEVMVVIDSEEFARKVINKLEYEKQFNSLKVAEDGSYAHNPFVIQEEVSLGKKMGTRVLSWLTRFVEYLL